MVIYHGWELGIGSGSRVLVVEERKESGKLGEDATGLEFLMKFGYSVLAFMTNRLKVIIVLWDVATLMPTLKH